MADIRPSWIGGDCPQNLSDLVSFLSQRAAWIHKLNAQSEDPICPEFIKDIIARVWSPTQPSNDLNERASWAKGRIWLWVNNILTSVNWWLESSNFSGYPVWVSEPKSFVRVDQHFSILLGWCKENIGMEYKSKQKCGNSESLPPPDYLEKSKRWSFSKIWLVIPGIILLFLLPWCFQIVQMLTSLLEWFHIK